MGSKEITKILVLAGYLFVIMNCKIVFEDDFSTLDFTKWRHDITLSGGGNWEF